MKLVIIILGTFAIALELWIQNVERKSKAFEEERRRERERKVREREQWAKKYRH